MHFQLVCYLLKTLLSSHLKIDIELHMVCTTAHICLKKTFLGDIIGGKCSIETLNHYWLRGKHLSSIFMKTSRLFFKLS